MGKKGDIDAKSERESKGGKWEEKQTWKGITDWESRREKGLDNMINCHRAEDIQTEPKKDTPNPKAPALPAFT